MTYDMLFANKVIPGSRYAPSAELTHMRPHDWSNFFPWNNWGNGVEMSIMFVGSFDSTQGLNIDKSYMPFLITGCKSHFQKPPCVYEQAKVVGVPGMVMHQAFQFSCSDYRLFTVGDEIFMHDAYTNYLNKVVINHDKKIIRYEKWVTSVCQLPVSITGKDVLLENITNSSMNSSGGSMKVSARKSAKTPSSSTRRSSQRSSISAFDSEKFANELTNGAPYYKYFDKNWSFIGMQGSNLLFLDWFYENGVHAVSVDPETGYCTRKKIVAFNKDVIPKEADDVYPDFSLGTTTMSIAKSTSNMIDVIGVGHVKFHWDYVGFNGAKLYREIAKIDSIFNKTFGRNYKRHMKYVYACFFYRIQQTSKNKFEMKMSNLWVPFFEKEKEKYHSLVFFPMGVNKSLGNPQEFHVSAGLSDFYNAVMTFNKEDVLNKLVHDVSNMNLKKLSIDLITY
jgi:hypothetical protein